MKTHDRFHQIARFVGVAVLVWCGVRSITPAIPKGAPVDPQAYQLMINAVNARAVWDADFPGFVAHIKINYEGRLHTGRVQVRPDGEIKLTGLRAPDGQAQAWAQTWLGEMVFHRMGAQESDDQYRSIRMVGEKNDPLGPMLVMKDPLHSSFRIDGKVIRQVNRDLGAGGQGNDGPQHVRINVLDTALTPTGKVLPTQFVINYLNNNQALVAVDAVSSRFTQQGRYELPQWRRVITTQDGKITAAEMTLSNYRLL